MSWIATVRAILALLDTIGRALEQRRLIQAGEATEAARYLKGAIDAIDKARRARRDADRRNADRDELHLDDGFKRD